VRWCQGEHGLSKRDDVELHIFGYCTANLSGRVGFLVDNVVHPAIYRLT
jgi:hypothetical protein